MNKNVTKADVGMLEDGDYKPSLEVIVRETAFTAIECLLYYPSEENLKIIMEYTNHPNKELAKYAQESVEKMGESCWKNSLHNTPYKENPIQIGWGSSLFNILISSTSTSFHTPR